MRAARLCAAVALSLAVAAPAVARAQDLVAVPLTGRRVHTADAMTLFHTLFNDFFTEPDGTTYVQTGDIPAMWLRDSSAQTIPYLRFVHVAPVLRGWFAGVIERNARNILTDPYANAFQADYHVWERKWEIDSLAWPVVLAFTYWEESGDRSIFTPALHRALATVVATYSCEQRHASCSTYDYPYHVWTHESYNASTGMIWSAFRPSDDAVVYRYNVPQNQLAVVALRALALLASQGYGDAALARDASALANQVYLGIERYGRVYDPRQHGMMYVYETDGNGHFKLMDDANIPDLVAMPYIGWSSRFDPTYLRTRNFVLSSRNPYFFEGAYAEGVGSPHTPYRFVWPLGIIGRALTSTSSAEVAETVSVLAQTDSEQGLIHESFYADGYWRYTRADFGWANALYAELLFRSVAGMPGTPFTFDGYAQLPFERTGTTPALTPMLEQIENEGVILTSLCLLLAQRDGGS